MCISAKLCVLGAMNQKINLNATKLIYHSSISAHIPLLYGKSRAYMGKVANPRDFMIRNAKIGSKKPSIQVRVFSYIFAITERIDTS